RGFHVTGVQTCALPICHIVNKTIKRGGTVVCPAFAVGRAQSLIYYLHVLKQTGQIPDIPVYLDSPMAINVTELLHRHKSEHRLRSEERRVGKECGWPRW